MLAPFLSALAQLPAKALTSGEPRIDPEPSSILKLLLGCLFCVLVLVVAFKVSKRNQASE